MFRHIVGLVRGGANYLRARQLEQALVMGLAPFQIFYINAL
jgi:hypothetical protein